MASERYVDFAKRRFAFSDMEVDEFERVVWAILALGARPTGFRERITDEPGQVLELQLYDRKPIGPPTELEAEFEHYERVQTMVRFLPGDFGWAR